MIALATLVLVQIMPAYLISQESLGDGLNIKIVLTFPLATAKSKEKEKKNRD